MPQSLGSIYVELNANTAKFVDALSKAAYTAQQSAKNISKEFSSLQRIASQTFGAFGSFNPAISQLSFALSTMGRAASSAMKEFGSTKSALGAIASLGAGATAAIASIEVATIGVAVHAAQSAEKLYELAQSTGVSTEALSGLGFAARQVGVDQETMARGLEKMSKSAFAAATAPAGAINAYTRLGIAVRDSSGQIRSTEAIFADIAGKFASMPDGVAKTALAIELFGRNGAALLPALNLGKAGIDGMMASAARFGIVVNGETAQAAHQFSLKLGELDAIANGFALTLARDLLPLLSAITSSFESSAEGANKWAHAIAELTRMIAVPLDAIWTAVNQAAIALVGFGAQLEYIVELANDLSRALLTVNFKGFAEGLKTYSSKWTSSLKDDVQSSKGIWSDFAAFVKNTSPGDRTGWMVPVHRQGSANIDTATKSKGLGVSTKDVVGEDLAKLQAQATAELSLAGAMDRTTAAMMFQKAAAEAAQKVQDVRNGLLTEQKSLQEQLSTSTGEESARISARIAGVRKELAALDAAAPQFTKLYAQIAAAKASSSTSDELQKKSDDFDKQIASLTEVSASYGKGPAAVASAEIDKQLAAEKDKIDDLRDEYARLQAIPGIGIVGKEQGQGPSPALSQLSAAIDAATEKFSALKTQAATLRDLGIDAELNKQAAELQGATPLVEALNHAYLENEQAVRAAQVALELYRWTQAHPGASVEQINAENEALRTQSNQAYATAIAQEAAQYDIAAAYNNRIQKLEQVRELIQSEGASTLLIDAAIYDAQRQQIEQWDQAAIKVGSFGEQMHAVLNQVALDAEDVGGKIADAMNKAIGGVEDNIAKLIVTGKSNFKQMFEGFAESMIKIQLQSAAGSLEKAIGIKIPGLEGKRGESSGNPLFVQEVGAGKLPLGPGFGSGRSYGSILGAPGTATTPPFLSPGNTTSSGPGGIIGSIAKVFGIKTGGGGSAPTGSSNDPIYVLTATAGSSVFGAATDNSGGGILGDLTGNLPLGPGFGSGKSSTGLMSLLSPESDSSGGSGLLSTLDGLFGGTSSDSSRGDSSGSTSGGGLLSMLGGLFGGGGGGGDSSDPGSGGGLFSDIFNIFAGFRASGGPADHGSAYIVGEKGPELFVPKSSGTIIPSFSLMKSSQENNPLAGVGQAFDGFRAAGGDVTPGHSYVVGENHPEVFIGRAARSASPSSSSPGGGGARETTVNFHVHGVSDHDSFRRSQSQIYAGLHAQMELARARG
jgi:lambda family phage tail tape measure protein